MTETRDIVLAVLFAVPALAFAWVMSPDEMSDAQRYEEAGYPPAWEQPAEIEE